MPADDDPFDHLQRELAVLTRRAEHLRLGAAHASSETMERSSFLLLGYLCEHGPQTPTALAESFGLNASTITRQVAALVRRDWVTRMRNPAAPRTTLVQITDRGRADHEVVRVARKRLFADLLADWPLADVAMAAELIDRLNASVLAARRTPHEWADAHDAS